jgi:hypothetical protein
MRNVNIIVASLVPRTLCWAIGFSFLLSVVNILIPDYAPAISILISAFFIERETRKRKRQYVHPLVSPFLVSIMSAPIAYEFTSGICALSLMWSKPQKYCFKELYSELAVIEGVMLMVPWVFILFMFLWYRVIFRKKYSPE